MYRQSWERAAGARCGTRARAVSIAAADLNGGGGWGSPFTCPRGSMAAHTPCPYSTTPPFPSLHSNPCDANASTPTRYFPGFALSTLSAIHLPLLKTIMMLEHGTALKTLSIVNDKQCERIRFSEIKSSYILYHLDKKE